MGHTLTFHDIVVGIGHFFEHALFVMIGLMMMVIGLALGVTMVMLPLGVAVGLMGLAMVVGGLFAHFE